MPSGNNSIIYVLCPVGEGGFTLFLHYKDTPESRYQLLPKLKHNEYWLSLRHVIEYRRSLK